jgi:hypothetical protein
MDSLCVLCAFVVNLLPTGFFKALISECGGEKGRYRRDALPTRAGRHSEPIFSYRFWMTLALRARDDRVSLRDEVRARGGLYPGFEDSPGATFAEPFGLEE